MLLGGIELDHRLKMDSLVTAKDFKELILRNENKKGG